MRSSTAARTAAGTLALATCLGGGALALAGSANAALGESPEPTSKYDDTSVVLASSDSSHLVDSVSAGPFAALQATNIVLTPSGSLNADTATYLHNTRPEVIYVIGGVSAVSDAVITQALDADAGASVYRLEGHDRHATAIAIGIRADSMRDHFEQEDQPTATPTPTATK